MYADSHQFWLWGVENLEPDVAHADQDCPICLEPLVMNPPEDLGLSEGIEYHYAVRILACSHVHANDCLMEWLQVGNTCPTCNLVLFSPPQEEPLDAEDMEDLFSDLAIRFGVDRAYTSLFLLVSPDERRVMAARLDEERDLEEQREMEEEDEMYCKYTHHNILSWSWLTLGCF